MRRSSNFAVAAGIIAIAAAGTLRFVVVPGQSQLPADTDTTRSYEGTIATMLNAEALAAGDLDNAIVRDLPVTLERSTLVTDVADGNATVRETAGIFAPDGSPVLASDTTFVVDRRTMLGQGDRSGLLMGWPIDTEPRDYTGWSGDLQSEVTLTYTGQENFQGIEALVFTSDISGRIVDVETLSRFPSALPKFVLPMVAGALTLSPEAEAALPSLLSVLPDSVPLAYFLNSTTTYWVDPATGMVLDLDRTESRQVAFDVEGIPATPLADVYSISYQGTEASVAQTVADSNANSSKLATFGSTVPIALLVLALALFAFAARGGRKPSEPTAPPVAPNADPTSAEREHAHV